MRGLKRRCFESNIASMVTERVHRRCVLHVRSSRTKCSLCRDLVNSRHVQSVARDVPALPHKVIVPGQPNFPRTADQGSLQRVSLASTRHHSDTDLGVVQINCYDPASSGSDLEDRRLPSHWPVRLKPTILCIDSQTTSRRRLAASYMPKSDKRPQFRSR